MLAALGFLVGENYHPLFGLAGEEILAIDSLTEVWSSLHNRIICVYQESVKLVLAVFR